MRRLLGQMLGGEALGDLGALKNPDAFPPFFNSLTVTSEESDVVANVTFTLADVEFAQKKAEEALNPDFPDPSDASAESE